MALNLVAHFELTASGTIAIYKLKEAEKEQFLSKLTLPFRRLYISDEALEQRIRTFKTEKSQEIREKIPDKPNIMSGEFAELLLYYLIPERYSDDEAFCPPKWRWKQHKNRALQFTDVVVLRRVDVSKPSPNDYVISVESKAQSTKPPDESVRLNDAIAGCEEDHVSRFAESLVYLKARYKDEMNVSAVTYLERFMELPRFPTYKKHFKAVAIVDENFVHSELKGVQPISKVLGPTLEVLLISMTNLKECYEVVYQKMVEL